MRLFRVTDGWDSECPPHIQTVLVSRETEKCYVIRDSGFERFVRKDPQGKRYAYLSREDAIKSYITRKERQVKIKEAQLRQAQTQLAYAKTNRFKDLTSLFTQEELTP